MENLLTSMVKLGKKPKYGQKFENTHYLGMG
jgi:hypothetical protein